MGVVDWGSMALFSRQLDGAPSGSERQCLHAGFQQVGGHVGGVGGGDGARARAAADAALGVDPGYSLALLGEVSLQAGVPPREVARLFTEVSRERCRLGTA